MLRRLLSVPASLLALCLFVPALATEDTATVLRVIDGDTIEVSVLGAVVKVRLIGVDTPETVHPTKPVEAFWRYLKSVIPMPLKDAAARYAACSVCRPPLPKAGR